MITVFFNEDGYYVTGESVESAQRCSPALTVRGDRIFQPIHHTYKVLYLALCEVRDMDVMDDVMVYNDSRIIDEINGLVEPLDDTCGIWLQTMKRDVIPTIRSVVFFRKKPTTHVNTTVTSSHGRMIRELDPKQRQELAERDAKIREDLSRARNRRLVNRLRESWFGEKTDG